MKCSAQKASGLALLKEAAPSLTKSVGNALPDFLRIIVGHETVPAPQAQVLCPPALSHVNVAVFACNIQETVFGCLESIQQHCILLEC